MSEADEQFVNCLWTQIEELLSLPPEEREAVDIEDVSTWFRNRSSLFQSIDKREEIFFLILEQQYLYTLFKVLILGFSLIF